MACVIRKNSNKKYQGLGQVGWLPDEIISMCFFFLFFFKEKNNSQTLSLSLSNTHHTYRHIEYFELKCCLGHVSQCHVYVTGHIFHLHGCYLVLNISIFFYFECKIWDKESSHPTIVLLLHVLYTQYWVSKRGDDWKKIICYISPHTGTLGLQLIFPWGSFLHAVFQVSSEPKFLISWGFCCMLWIWVSCIIREAMLHLKTKSWSWGLVLQEKSSLFSLLVASSSTTIFLMNTKESAMKLLKRKKKRERASGWQTLLPAVSASKTLSLPIFSVQWFPNPATLEWQSSTTQIRRHVQILLLLQSLQILLQLMALIRKGALSFSCFICFN